MNAVGLRALAVASVLMAAGLSWQRSAVWSGPLSFWADSVHANPANSRAQFGLGTTLLAVHDCKSAVRELTLARSEDALDPQIEWNLAEAYLCNKQPELALPLFQAFTNDHPSADAWNKVAYTKAVLERFDEVFSALANALRLDPNNATSYSYQGFARLALNNPSGARSDFQRALELDPQNSLALDGIQRVDGLSGK
jgi:tetratricopeptide (TPR) repeat protein